MPKRHTYFWIRSLLGFHPDSIPSAGSEVKASKSLVTISKANIWQQQVSAFRECESVLLNGDWAGKIQCIALVICDKLEKNEDLHHPGDFLGASALFSGSEYLHRTSWPHLSLQPMSFSLEPQNIFRSTHSETLSIHLNHVQLQNQNGRIENGAINFRLKLEQATYKVMVIEEKYVQPFKRDLLLWYSLWQCSIHYRNKKSKKARFSLNTKSFLTQQLFPQVPRGFREGKSVNVKPLQGTYR